MSILYSSRLTLFQVALLLVTAPIGKADIGDLRITEVDPVDDLVEVTHFSTGTYTTASSLPFCHRFSYASSIPSGTTFTGGQVRVIAVSNLNDTDSDIWLYRDGNFGSSASILTGIKYGPAINVGRETVAAAAGIWPSGGEFVPSPGAGQTLQLNAYDGRQPSNWISAASSTGLYWGTGTVLTRPLPDIPKSSFVVGLERIATNLISPLGLRDPGDATGRLFIYDQAGYIYIHRKHAVEAVPFLVVTNRLASLTPSYDERGLIGFELHPDFTNNGKLYTYTSEIPDGPADFTVTISGATNNQAVIAEWMVSTNNPDIVDPASRRELLRIDDPQFNHNGGDLVFGPDGYLYIAIGDGGAANDNADGHRPAGNGQNPSTIFGSILRIDVQGTNAANGQYGIPPGNPFVGQPDRIEEIFAYGLRNPYRMSFRNNGDLIVADVGQGEIEELNILQAGDNAGWRLLEGDYFFDPAGELVTIPVAPLPDDLVAPIASYDHDDGLAIVGGYDVGNQALPGLENHYVFGEFGTGFGVPSGRLLVLSPSNTIHELTIGRDDRDLGVWVKGMGQDREGYVYLLGSTSLGPDGNNGSVFRIIPLIDRLIHEGAATSNSLQFAADPSMTNLAVEVNDDLLDVAGWAPSGSVAPVDLDRYTTPWPVNATNTFEALRVINP